MKIILYAIVVLFFIACGDSAPKASINFQTASYISQTDENNHTIIKDLRQNLIFVNSMQGCKALHGSKDEVLQKAEDFCQQLSFFGITNWHVPTLKEVQSISKGMDEDKLIPYFTFPECKRIVGIKTDGTLGNIHTHNVSPKFKEVPLELPAGLRCVTESF